MFGIADYGAFVAAIIVFLLIPGPGNLALVTSTGPITRIEDESVAFDLASPLDSRLPAP